MYETLLPKLSDYFRHKVTTFKAGCLAAHVKEWQSLTSDLEILETVVKKWNFLLLRYNSNLL